MSLSERWYTAFLSYLERHETARPLQDAAAAGRLEDWTTALTGIVVDVCAQLGWLAAAKGHPGKVLPVARSEYLALDTVAFDRGGKGETSRWPFPVAVFELENSADDDKVAYSLWKVLCVRAPLRVVFCYRGDVAAGSALVRHLAAAVVGSLPLAERADLPGEVLVVVGNRAEGGTFPYGYFKAWTLDRNTGVFGLI